MRRKLCTAGLAVAVWALATAGSAFGHFVVVSPRGEGEGTAHHVGQTSAAGHNSCAGHLTASRHEQSAAVTFLGPPVCPP